MTPAILARRLAPGQVTIAGGPVADRQGPLAPVERLAVARVAPARLAEFTAGRWAARVAILDITGDPAPVVLPRRNDGPPIWPPGLTGSIAHGGGQVLAAAARLAQMQALGIDLEPAGAVAPDLAPEILRPDEAAWTSRLTAAFVAKEAAYKAQYMLTGRMLGFHDVRLIPGAADCAGLVVPVTWAEDGGFVVAVSAIPV